MLGEFGFVVYVFLFEEVFLKSSTEWFFFCPIYFSLHNVIKFKINMTDAEFTNLPAHHAIENILDKPTCHSVLDFKNTSSTKNT